MTNILILIIVLAIVAPALGIWADALDRRDKREAIAVGERPARRRAGRK
jgi:hypothetical protein